VPKSPERSTESSSASATLCIVVLDEFVWLAKEVDIPVRFESSTCLVIPFIPECFADKTHGAFVDMAFKSFENNNPFAFFFTFSSLFLLAIHWNQRTKSKVLARTRSYEPRNWLPATNSRAYYGIVALAAISLCGTVAFESYYQVQRCAVSQRYYE